MVHSSKCKSFVDKYVDKLVDLIADKVPFSKICSKLHLCSAPLPPTLTSKLQLNNTSSHGVLGLEFWGWGVECGWWIVYSLVKNVLIKYFDVAIFCNNLVFVADLGYFLLHRKTLHSNIGPFDLFNSECYSLIQPNL